MARHSRVAQDVVAHFALREAEVGAEFEVKGFWRLALARGIITHELLDLALDELVQAGMIVKSGHAHFLTQKGFHHIYGREHATAAHGERHRDEG